LQQEFNSDDESEENEEFEFEEVVPDAQPE